MRSRSLPGVSSQGTDDDSSNANVAPGRDSGVIMGSEPPSYVSDPRSSSLVGDLPSGGGDNPSADSRSKKKDSKSSPEDETKKATIGRHYYPEGGWGWVVLFVCVTINCLVHGVHQSIGTMLIYMGRQFPYATLVSRSEYIDTFFALC